MQATAPALCRNERKNVTRLPQNKLASSPRPIKSKCSGFPRSSARSCRRYSGSLTITYEAARAKGLYKDQQGREQYAINTVAEYWAEGTQWWFWSNIEFYDGTTGQRVQTPDEFKGFMEKVTKAANEAALNAANMAVAMAMR